LRHGAGGGDDDDDEVGTCHERKCFSTSVKFSHVILLGHAVTQ